MTQHDVLVIGGGLNGLSQALALAFYGVNVGLVEAKPFKELHDPKGDQRTTAVAACGVRFYDRLGVWEAMKPHAGPIDDIRICDSFSPINIHYSKEAVGGAPMGYILDNCVLRQTMLDAFETYDNATVYNPVSYQAIKQESNFVEVSLSTGETVKAKLLLAADGKFSNLRRVMGIPTKDISYNQTAITCNIKHSKPHGSVALERFMPSGPFAVLPMQDQHQSSIVWTVETETAPHFMGLDEDAFIDELEKRAGFDWLGNISLSTNPRGYPLILIHARSLTSSRFALVGDAGHSIHPIAGQGFNLGLRDIAVMTELVLEFQKNGLDIGSAALLKKYADLRKPDHSRMIAATHQLNLLFSNNHIITRAVRKLGMGTVDRLPKVKTFFQEEAMGVGKQTPTLMRAA